MNKDKIIYIENDLGHRQSYLKLFAETTGFTPEISPLSIRNILKLILAKQLFFVTVGKSYRRYFIISFIRFIMLKRTVSLFLGVHHYAKIKVNKISLDYILLKIWKSLPNQKVYSILPYHIDFRLSKFTNDYIYDPQLWDLTLNYNSYLKGPNTQLSREILKKKNNRKIIIYIGIVSSIKSINSLVKIAEQNRDEYLIAVAGMVTDESKEDVIKLKSFGMFVEDRFITDDELFSLYNIADFAWCYYNPKYDQSSGVFGRAIQLGVIPIIRKNSILSLLSRRLGFKTIELDLKNYSLKCYEFENVKITQKGYENNLRTLKQIGKQSLLKIKKSL